MSIPESSRLDHPRGSLLTQPSLPSPRSGGGAYDQPTPDQHSPNPYLPSPRPTPSATMQIPLRHAQPILRDPFPFTSPPKSTHLARSPHNLHPGHHHPMSRHESLPSHNSLSSPVDATRPRPPPLRTAQSAYIPRDTRESSPLDDLDVKQAPTKDAAKRNSGDGDIDELTTKGRKRKRLAKACSACHKNKRRCDGFAPCSNCEFSSRPCLYLNAMGETIPPPRTRDSIGQAGSGAATPAVAKGQAGKGGSQPMSQTGSGQGSLGRASSQEGKLVELDNAQAEATGPRGSGSIPAPTPRRRTAPEVVDSDPVLGAELVDTFFRISAPFSAMLHPPTFHHRQYLSQVSPILLEAIYAFAARSSSSPALLGCYPPDHPPWLRGEGFAERAHAEAERIVTSREAEHVSGRSRKEGTWQELEEIQAFTLLSIYFACLRQPTLALFYLDMAISMLRPTFSVSARSDSGISPVELATLAESRVRTFWLIALHDLCAAANGRARLLTDREMEGVSLPGPEASWVRFGGRSPSRSEGETGWKRRDGLVLGSGNWSGEEGQVGELGHVLRILSIFSNIMAVANGTGSGSDARSVPLHQHQDALKNLPAHLRFDEHNLSTSVTRLQSPLPHIAFSGWAFGYMHAIAECGMFYLQAAVAQQPGASWTAQRQSQAVDNIAVVLDAMGERGREGPLMIFPLAVVSNWQDHIRSTHPVPTPSQLQLDDRLSLWWAEARHQWGAERDHALEKGPPPGSKGSVLPAYPEDAYRGGSISRDPRDPGGWPNSSDGRYQSRGYADHIYGGHPDHDHRRSSPSGSHQLQHLLGTQSTNGRSEASNAALGLYSISTSPRDIMAHTVMRNGLSQGSSDAYLHNPYPRSESLSDPYHRQSRRTSPPDLAHSISTSASHLLPTPHAARHSLPPLPALGARPRAASSVAPYSPNGEPSPVSARAFGSTSGIERRLPASLSISEIDVRKRRYDGRADGPSSAGSRGYYLPPSAELRQLRQVDDVLGLGSGGASGRRADPFSPSLSGRRGEAEKIRYWSKDVMGAEKKDQAGEEPFGIAALISAAESEREREEQRRESEGSSTGSQVRREADGVANKEDVEMRDETNPGVASQDQQTVVA